eukprot:4225975-Prymnesium_polylepis.1
MQRLAGGRADGESERACRSGGESSDGEMKRRVAVRARSVCVVEVAKGCEWLTGNGRCVRQRLHTRVESGSCGPQATWDRASQGGP